jgi:hypothetical protein
MFEVGDLVRFRWSRSGIIGQILDVDHYESCAAITYRVLLLTGDSITGNSIVGNICEYIDDTEIELHE